MPVVVVVSFNLGQQLRPIRVAMILIGTIGKYQASASRLGHPPAPTVLVIDCRSQAVGVFDVIHLATIKMDFATIGETPCPASVSLPILGDGNRRTTGVIVNVAVRSNYFVTIGP
jgi:hypothetical protein